jgi:hypothetical protein
MAQDDNELISDLKDENDDREVADDEGYDDEAEGEPGGEDLDPDMTD